MPLENLVGSKYISDLNENWPAGTDLPDAGDDHMRGIKNVLKRSFPGITGPVTLTQDEINRGSVPSGSICLFYQAAAPAGWSRTAGIGNTFGIRIVASANPGGGSGGTDDPVLNDKVPSHAHSFAATSGTESADHSHYVSGNTGGQSVNHSHAVSDPGHSHSESLAGVAFGAQFVAGNGWIGQGGQTGGAYSGISLGGESTTHTHAWGAQSGGRNTGHSHTVSGTTGANAPAANWVPRYVDMILCTRD